MPKETPEEQPKPEKTPKRAVIQYRTRKLEAFSKWSLWFQRELTGLDSQDVMTQFYARPTWPAMTGMIEVKSITWD